MSRLATILLVRFLSETIIMQRLAMGMRKRAIAERQRTTRLRGRAFFKRPPPTRPLQTFESPTSQTSSLSRAPGRERRSSSLVRAEFDCGGPESELGATVGVGFPALGGVSQRARRASKCSIPGGGRRAISQRSSNWVGEGS